MKVIAIGGGIAGLAFALGMHARGRACVVYEQVPEVREIGVGLTLLPHAMRELAALGLEPAIRAVAIENEQSAFFTRHGQFIYQEPRGKLAGYPYPEYGIPRGKLHRILYDAVLERCGAQSVVTNHRCTRVDQDESGVTAYFVESSTGRALDSVRADAAIACDGVNSTVRKHFYPHEQLAFAGINTWRGVTRHAPILGGRTYLRVGSIETGKIVIYPIVDDVDGRGNQLVNWVAEIRQPEVTMNDWNKPGDLADFHAIYAGWKFDWLDVGELVAKSDMILEYPMVDRDPVARWSFGRVTLMGDAAHPMYPRGSNGAAQAIIDARTAAEQLAATSDPVAALAAYEAARLEPTARVVRTNREHPPDFINIRVDQLTGGKPFRHIDDVISQDELRKISEDYKRIAGFSLANIQGKT
jgi:2-polyprenyl-6-methoxyphenol hydroxylase-like FAD-dependent oxidoreductase